MRSEAWYFRGRLPVAGGLSSFESRNGLCGIYRFSPLLVEFGLLSVIEWNGGWRLLETPSVTAPRSMAVIAGAMQRGSCRESEKSHSLFIRKALGHLAGFGDWHSLIRVVVVMG